MLWSKLIKFPMSIFKRQVNSYSNFASFFIVITHYSSVNFELILFLLWIKGSHQSPNFDTSKCSGENLPYSSCHFQVSFSSDFASLFSVMKDGSVTPLYFFSSNIKYFAQQEPMKVHIFETFECSSQNSPNSCHF